MLRRMDPLGYTVACAAVRDADFGTQLSSINSPTLIVCGADDPVTTVDDGLFIASRIHNAKLLTLNAAHLSNIEAAESFSIGIEEFVSAHSEGATHG